MNFCIFIPTYNASLHLDTLIPVLNQFGCSDKIYIVDSSSSDNTVSCFIDAGFNQVMVISAAEFDHGGTRALANCITDTDVVVFLTQDALPQTFNEVRKLIRVFEDNSIGAAYGRQIPYDSTNLFGKHLRYFNYPDSSYIRSYNDRELFGIKTTFISNSFAAYRRSAMDRIGWFKSGLILGEDVYAGAKLLQAGYQLAYVSDAQVYHSHSYTVFEEFKRYFDIGVFHQMESWILDEFGKPVGEGVRYIKSEFKYLIAHKAYNLIPEFFIRNFMKFLGYKFGIHHESLPKSWTLNFSMHYRWWDKFWSGRSGVK